MNRKEHWESASVPIERWSPTYTRERPVTMSDVTMTGKCSLLMKLSAPGFNCPKYGKDKLGPYPSARSDTSRGLVSATPSTNCSGTSVLS